MCTYTCMHIQNRHGELGRARSLLREMLVSELNDRKTTIYIRICIHTYTNIYITDMTNWTYVYIYIHTYIHIHTYNRHGELGRAESLLREMLVSESNNTNMKPQ